ncbi:MAG: hypothetical protein OHK93_001379 [Ramalina farinacea]|uniref:Uncharacterized protein n=1 Tax=Ramalina farinacea TaxID=258253 RepID=A0AA43QR46_9LECA|nr:hypothetical protein [Ramalina farinacea]
MPRFKRSRQTPGPSHAAPFSLTLFNKSYHLLASSPRTLHLLHLTSNIASSVLEAHRLLTLKSSLLHPQDLDRATSVIADTETALHDIAQLIKPARVTRPRAAILDLPLFDKNNSKSTWVLHDSPHARALHNRLSSLHGSLMSVLSILYLSDLRWPFVAAKPETEPPQYNEKEASPPPPAYDSVVEKPFEKQHQHIWNGPQTTRIPTTTSRCAIDNPYTWQPPPPEEGKLQHSKSDPTPQHNVYMEGFRHRVYRHENISSEYLRGCRLNEPWTVEFAVADEEEGERRGSQGGAGMGMGMVVMGWNCRRG